MRSLGILAAAGMGGVEIEFHATGGNSEDGDTFGSYNTTRNMGEPGKRLAVIGVGISVNTGNSATVGALTVGGVSATRLVRSSGSSGHLSRAELWAAEIEAGGSMAVNINLSGGARLLQATYYTVRRSREVYSVYGNRSSGTQGDSDTMSNSEPQPRGSGIILMAAATRDQTLTNPDTSIGGVDQDMNNGRDATSSNVAGRYRSGHRHFEDAVASHTASHTLESLDEFATAIARFS